MNVGRCVQILQAVLPRVLCLRGVLPAVPHQQHLPLLRAIPGGRALNHSILTAKTVYFVFITNLRFFGKFSGFFFDKFKVFLTNFQDYLINVKICLTSFKIYAWLLCKNHILLYIQSNQSNTLRCKTCIHELDKIIDLGAQNGPVGWTGLRGAEAGSQKTSLERTQPVL